MPYINKEKRVILDTFLDSVAMTSGELNYVFTSVILDYIAKHGVSYQTCNDIVGALENCKHEFQRRFQDPYEDLKIKENGDVYK